jgi:hypothetical protein
MDFNKDDYDEFGDRAQPRQGFVFPDKGDEIIAISDYQTAAHKGERTVQKGDVGIVTGIRMPGTFDKEHGYIGLVVHFKRVAESYPAGFVIRWDKASNPEMFCIPNSDAKEIAETAQGGVPESTAVFSRPLNLKRKV